MKRALALMLAVVLAMSLGITAFAANGGTITIDNATKNEEYKLYKIFEAVYSDDKSNVAYTVSPELAAIMFGTGAVDFDTENDAKGMAADYFDYVAETGSVTVNDEYNSTWKDADLFEYLSKLVDLEALQDAKFLVATKTAEGEEVVFENLADGYYVIRRANDKTNAVTITHNNQNVHVIDKNQLPSELVKKVNGGATSSAAVGEDVNFELSFTATNYKGDKEILNYTLTDTLDPVDWANINIDSIKVYVTDMDTPLNTDKYEVKNIVTTADGTVSGFELYIPWADENADGEYVPRYDATADVKVTYTATVLSNALSEKPEDTDYKNTADMTYSTEDATSDPSESETEVYVLNLGFTKVDGEGNGLAGAKFYLYSDAACTNRIAVTMTADGVYVVGGDEDDVIESPEDGAVIIQGLKAGKYYLQEIEAPAGYNKLAGAVEVEVVIDNPEVDNDSDAININNVEYTANNTEENIVNLTGVQLPETGGKGTMMLITFGTMVAVAFAVLMITQKKMSIYND